MAAIIIDDRRGSADLVPYLRAVGVRVEIERMEYGDFAFVGNGPEGPTPVGLEYKTLSDVAQCIVTGRFAGRQFLGLRDSYPVFALLFESEHGADSEGRLMLRTRGRAWRYPKRDKFPPPPPVPGVWMYRSIEHWLMSLEYQGGLRVLRTRDKKHSALYLKTLFSWWVAKEWKEHQTLKTLDNTVLTTIGYCRPSPARKFAALMPGVGWERSAAVAERLTSVEDIVFASAKDYAKIPGIGKITARKMRNWITRKGA